MTISTHTTIPAPSETSVSRAFAILLDRLSDLTQLEAELAPSDWAETREHHSGDLTRAQIAVLAAAQDTLERPAEHLLDGSLHRLATLAELQMTLLCPEERASLYNQVMAHHDLFEIMGTGALERRVRGLQKVFFQRYSALIEGPQIADISPETGHFEACDAIPA